MMWNQPPFLFLAHCFLCGAVVTLCQKAMDSIGSCITRPFFTLFIFFEKLTIGVVYNINKYEKLIAPESSKWTRIATSLQGLGLYIPCSPRLFPSSVKMAYQ